MDFLGDRQDAQDLRNNRNHVIVEKTNIKNSVLDYIKYKQLNWYVHVRRMNEERLPQRILEWHRPGSRSKERPWNSWMQEVTSRMKKMGNNMEWIDREEWRRKIKL